MASKQVNMHEAKTHLSRLAAEAAGGEEIVIARNGEPVAKLVAVEPRKPVRFGWWEGEVHYHGNFDDPLPWEIQKYFEGHGD